MKRSFPGFAWLAFGWLALGAFFPNALHGWGAEEAWAQTPAVEGDQEGSGGQESGAGATGSEATESEATESAAESEPSGGSSDTPVVEPGANDPGAGDLGTDDPGADDPGADEITLHGEEESAPATVHPALEEPITPTQEDTAEDGAAPPAAPGEDEEAPAEEARTDSGPFPTAEIGRRIEETFQELQALAPMLRRQPAARGVQRAIPNFVTNVDRLAEDPALERLNTLHSASLQDLEHEWGRLRLRLTGWQEGLESRTESLTEARERTVAVGRRWLATRDTDRAEPLPPSQRSRIDSLLERIDAVLTRLDRRLTEVLGLQGELSDQGIRVARQLSRIESAQQHLRDRRQRRDHRPLWRGWSPLGDEVEAPSQEVVAQEHLASLSEFLYAEKKSLGWHAFGLLTLMLLFFWLRRKVRSGEGKGKEEEESLASLGETHIPGTLEAVRAVRAHPIASALLLVHVLAPVLYSYVPVVVVGASLVVMVPVLHRLGLRLLPIGHREVLALMILAALSVPLSLGFAPDWSRRFYVLALQVGSFFFALRLWSPQVGRIVGRASRSHGRLYLLLRLSVLPLAFATYSLFAGYTERAELWTTGTLWVIEQAIGLFFGLRMLSALLRMALRRPGARMLFMVRDHRRQVARYLLRTLGWAAVALFLFLALTSFDLLDPTLATSRNAFRRTFEFGSIELSFGSVVAFVAMLIGTFVVMRLVHVLLEYEILPRFDLEQGISSAISLTASYLLVAIGVVLAFGVAGVGPERLALLGGALGVGIGFGLQNVVSNFVSGLILVAERPIQVGDVIEVDGDLVGTVQRIGIRSSTVLSLNGAEVIVPNADLVSGKLINWTLSDTRRRLELVVGAAYHHDPKEVMAVLRRVVGRQRGLLHDPPVEVICTAFGDSAIEYTVRAWTQGYLEAIEAKSRLAAAVYAEFARQDIEIPFPQQDLHIKSMPEALETSATNEPGDGRDE